MFKWLFFVVFLVPMISFSQMASIELPSRPVPIPASRDTVVDRWNQSQPGFQYLSQQGRDFLYWINYCRRNPEGFWENVVIPNLDVFPPLNGKEAQSLKADLEKTGPLPMFSLNNALIKTAQLHATDISGKKAAPSHTSTDGTDFGSRMKRAGIKYCANENISVSSQGSLLAVLLLYLDIGLPTMGHRKSLLNPTLVETGVGTAPYGNGQFFLVQDLSCSQQ
jgi:hypothetical protein